MIDYMEKIEGLLGDCAGRENKCFFTGHRFLPEKELPSIKRLLKSEILKMIESGAFIFLNGGAAGFDLLAAEIVLDLKARMPEVKLYMYYPYMDQPKYFDKASKALWERTMREADGYSFACASYTKIAFHIRNHAMADEAAHCIAYCTEPVGGTYSTLRYAEKAGCSVINLANMLFYGGTEN